MNSWFRFFDVTKQVIIWAQIAFVYSIFFKKIEGKTKCFWDFRTFMNGICLKSPTLVWYQIWFTASIFWCSPGGCWLFRFDARMAICIPKVERILKGSLDLIKSPSHSMKIQIIGRKVCLMCTGKTLSTFCFQKFVYNSSKLSRP